MNIDNYIKPGYKKTPVGIIPEDWEVKKLGDFLKKIIGGGTPSRSRENYWGGNIPWATVKDFASFNPTKTQEYITRKGLENSSSNLVPANTLITATRMGLGRVSVYDVDVAINQDLKALFPKNNLDREYLYHWFNNNQNYIESLGNGSTVKGITLNDLKSLRFYEVPLEEQKTIANCLSTWDSGIEKLTQLIQAKKLRKKGLMQQLLTGKKRLAGFEGEWKEVKLKKYINERNIRGQAELEILTSAREGLMYQREYFKKSVASENLDNYKVIHKGDLTYRAMSDDGIFVFNRLEFTDKGLVSPAYSVFYLSNINPYFFYYLINHNSFRRYTNKIAQGGTRLTLKLDALKKINIKLPEREEQDSIANILQAADKEIELMEQKLEAFKEQKKGLMQVLLTGERRLVGN